MPSDLWALRSRAWTPVRERDRLVRLGSVRCSPTPPLSNAYLWGREQGCEFYEHLLIRLPQPAAGEVPEKPRGLGGLSSEKTTQLEELRCDCQACRLRTHISDHSAAWNPLQNQKPLLYCLRNSALGNGAWTGMISFTCCHSGVARP